MLQNNTVVTLHTQYWYKENTGAVIIIIVFCFGGLAGHLSNTARGKKHCWGKGFVAMHVSVKCTTSCLANRPYKQTSTSNPLHKHGIYMGHGINTSPLRKNNLGGQNEKT